MECPNCGQEVKKGSSYCTNCGAQLEFPQPPGGKTSRSWKPILITGIVLAVVVTVVLVLVFTVFTGDGEDGPSVGSSDPEAAVEAFLAAIEGQDVDALVEAIDPAFIDDLKGEYGQQYKELLDGFFLLLVPVDFNISGLEFETEIDENTATVRVVAGTVTYTDEAGNEVSEDITDIAVVDYELVEADGKWHVSMDTFPDWSFYLEQI
jgi:hypothetical protein